MTIILNDTDLSRMPLMPIALSAIEEVFEARSAGKWISPPRHHVAFADKGDLVFTVGGVSGDALIAGFRVYDTFENSQDEQVVAVWSGEPVRLLGIVTGSRLGCARTGAIGGIALRHMSPPDARLLAIIGSGQQARAQLEAAAIVRKLDQVRVYSRDESKRRAFARAMGKKLGISIEAVTSPREAVHEADIVICATASPVPVIEADWLKPGVHINTIGPKTKGGHELGLDVAARAPVIATDSPEQALAYRPPFFLLGTPHAERMIDLSAIVGGKAPARQYPDQTTLFCSVGLAGTEVLVASKVLLEGRAQGGKPD